MPAPLSARRHARLDTLHANLRWFDALLVDLGALCSRAGISGGSRLVAFDPEEAPGPARTANLASVRLIGLGGQTTLDATSRVAADVWGDAVDVWLDLLDCLSSLSGRRAPEGMLLGLDQRWVAAWPADADVSAMRCSRIPTVVDVERLRHDADPYAALLAPGAVEVGIAHLNEAIELYDLHPLPPFRGE